MFLGRPNLLLRLEGAALLAGAVLLHWHGGHSWLAFAVLFFAPDLAMLGYLGGPVVGAAAYNAVHTTVLPIALVTFGVLAGEDMALAIALIWLAHIGFDRLLGYGLKYPEGFKVTHLSRAQATRPLDQPHPHT